MNTSYPMYPYGYPNNYGNYNPNNISYNPYNVQQQVQMSQMQSQPTQQVQPQNTVQRKFDVVQGKAAAEVDNYFNVTSLANITVPRGCCYTLSVENTSTIPINVQNSNLTINRTA